MFSISCLRLTLLILFVGSTTCYIVTSETRLEEFPLQVGNNQNPKSFFRFNFIEGKVEEIECPEEYSFDPALNHCVTDSKNHGQLPVETCTFKPTLPVGLNANPDSCFNFYNCDYTHCCYLMRCPDHLLYNSTSGQCDIPKEGACCEYMEKNPDRLVQ